AGRCAVPGGPLCSAHHRGGRDRSGWPRLPEEPLYRGPHPLSTLVPSQIIHVIELLLAEPRGAPSVGPNPDPRLQWNEGTHQGALSVTGKGTEEPLHRGAVRELTLRPRHCPPGLLATTLPPRQAPRRKRPRRECSDHRQHGSDASSCCPLPSGTRPQRMPRWSPHPGKR
ncbi:hypothetical protein EI555_003244, partial [Monodon monoceros]